jgi:hypothetical protein
MGPVAHACAAPPAPVEAATPLPPINGVANADACRPAQQGLDRRRVSTHLFFISMSFYFHFHYVN